MCVCVHADSALFAGRCVQSSRSLLLGVVDVVIIGKGSNTADLLWLAAQFREAGIAAQVPPDALPMVPARVHCSWCGSIQRRWRIRSTARVSSLRWIVKGLQLMASRCVSGAASLVAVMVACCCPLMASGWFAFRAIACGPRRTDGGRCIRCCGHCMGV